MRPYIEFCVVNSRVQPARHQRFPKPARHMDIVERVWRCLRMEESTPYSSTPYISSETNSAVSVTGHKIMHIVDLAVWTEAEGLRLGVSTASDCPDSPEVGPMTLHWLPIGIGPPCRQPITAAAWI